jgi:hypothetical protein
LQASARDLERVLTEYFRRYFPQQVTGRDGPLLKHICGQHAGVGKGTSNKAAFDTDLVMGDITSGNASYDGHKSN